MADHKWKKGDRVFVAATDDYASPHTIEIATGKVVKVFRAGKLMLDRRDSAWSYSRIVLTARVHPTKSAALSAFADQQLELQLQYAQKAHDCEILHGVARAMQIGLKD